MRFPYYKRQKPGLLKRWNRTGSFLYYRPYWNMKGEMRGSGIKSIPRGIRKTTQSNPALLTDRELDVLRLLHEGMQNKEIAGRLFISAKTVDHHISSILFKLEAKSRVKAVQEA